ncbi:unnamed protein product [Prorocentrum cordatum]|uniref:Uncharacterized protein n=1 Tax=Prorocentrum cordatum TaxID=2364126 RepID=A0ABN9UMZ4_9DINO|nr:unnamed protein product [Polarella glacialis]
MTRFMVRSVEMRWQPQRLSPAGRERGGRGGAGGKGGGGDVQTKQLLQRAAELAHDPALKKTLSTAAASAGQMAAEKVRHLAKRLAEALEAKRTAATACAETEGVARSAESGSGRSGRLFTSEWDEEFFDELDSMECEPSEKDALTNIQKQQEEVRNAFHGREDV